LIITILDKMDTTIDLGKSVNFCKLEAYITLLERFGI